MAERRGKFLLKDYFVTIVLGFILYGILRIYGQTTLSLLWNLYPFLGLLITLALVNFTYLFLVYIFTYSVAWFFLSRKFSEFTFNGLRFGAIIALIHLLLTLIFTELITIYVIQSIVMVAAPYMASKRLETKRAFELQELTKNGDSPEDKKQPS